MQGKNGGSGDSQQSVGICKRLFNLFMNNFIAQSLMRVTMGSTGYQMSQGSNEMQLEDQSSKSADQVGPNGNLNSEIVVEFRHTNGVGNWITLDNYGIDDHSPVENDDSEKLRSKGKEIGQMLGVTLEPSRVEEISTLPHEVQEKTDTQYQGKGFHELQPPNYGPEGQEKGLKRSVSIKESEWGRERNKKKVDEYVPSKRVTPAIQPEHPKPRPPRHIRPLLSVVSNINEKSDEFIRRRKEAMSKNSQP